MLKCLVLDLDNTIWGGIVGEDGAGNICLTPEYLAVQKTALDLKQRGILLAVSSKNNPWDALPVFDRPDMLIRPTDFTHLLINWRDKCVSLRQLANLLNIGLDALAFADDSPVERGLVKAQLPEVTVIDLPDDPAGYAAAIRAAFDASDPVTEEDAKRSGYYSEAKARLDAEQRATSREEFLRSLGLELEVGRAGHETVTRIAQLSQRTNQFTLTGQYHSDREIWQWLRGREQRGYWARLRDRFGDYGLIAAALVQAKEHTDELVEFYLSCRAMGRGVEYAFLETIRADCKGTLSIGKLIKTGRNVPATEFFKRLTPGTITLMPFWIKVHAPWWKQAGIYARVHAIAAETFGLPPDALTPESSPETVPEWDSLGGLNLILALESEYNIIFTAEEMEIPPTLGQLAEMVHKKKERR